MTTVPARLHKRQVDLLEFVAGFKNDHGHPPTFVQIAAGIGLKSSNSVGYHVMRLIALGYVTMEPGRSRTLVLKKKAPTA